MASLKMKTAAIWTELFKEAGLDHEQIDLGTEEQGPLKG